MHGPREAHTTFCDHRSQLKQCYLVSQHHISSSAAAQTCNISTFRLSNLLMESVPPWDLYIAAQHLIFTVTICNSHEPLATPSIIARVSILQAWVVVQWCCRFNDSHWWDFPPPISTNLVVGCSVRGRSHVCCESFSTVSSLFLPSFKSNLRTRPRKHPFGLTSPCSSNLLLSNRFRHSPRVFAISALRCHSVLESALDFTMQQEYRAIRTNDQQSSKLSAALHLCVITASANFV